MAIKKHELPDFLLPFIAGTVVASVVLIVAVAGAIHEGRVSGHPYVTLFDDPRGIDLIFARGDGQAYAALARDPTLSHPEVFRPDASSTSQTEMAYRSQRPLLPYLAFIAAVGRRGWTSVTLAVVVVLAAGLAAAATGVALARRGASSMYGVAVLLAPGAIANLTAVGPETLAVALAVLGVLAWSAEPRRPIAAEILFSAGVLARETLIVVPIVLTVIAVFDRVRTRGETDLVPVVGPIALWIAWTLTIRVRLGAWPFRHGQFEWPVLGTLDGIRRWNGSIAAPLYAAAAIALIIAVAFRRRRDVFGVVALAYVPLALVMAGDVWSSWANFGRPLLPLFVFAALALAGLQQPVAQVTGERRPSGRASRYKAAGVS